MLLAISGFAIINILVGVYLLLARNVQTVRALLTALLIINALGLLNSVVSTLRYISYISLSGVISLVISIGLFMYLLSVKGQVDILRVE
jgi:ABC-type proline/glycine betaine transport system permease subunit